MVVDESLVSFFSPPFSLLRRASGLLSEGTFFFCLDAAWLNEGRCPGGRPSVSYN